MSKPNNTPKVDRGRFEKETKKENVGALNNHYHPTNDPYRFALDNELGPIEMHAIKYVTRHHKKNGKRDLEAAKLAIDRLIKEYYS
jgi:hypothetical protein